MALLLVCHETPLTGLGLRHFFVLFEETLNSHNDGPHTKLV